MRRSIALLIILFIIVPAALTQDSLFADSYDDGKIAFDYPAGWFVEVDPNGTVFLSNTRIDIDSNEAQPGTIILRLGNPGDADIDAGAFLAGDLVEYDPMFFTGLMTGITVATDLMVTMIGGERGEFGVGIPELRIDKPLQYTTIEFKTNLNDHRIVYDPFSQWMLQIETAPDEMDQWRTVIDDILSTVTFPNTPIESSADDTQLENIQATATALAEIFNSLTATPTPDK